MNENPKWVTVASATQLMEATMIQVALGSHDIDSQLDGEYTVGVDPLLSNAIGGVRVQVAAEDEVRAREALTEMAQEKKAEQALKARTCPSCGSDQGQEVKKPNLIGILSVLTLGAFSLFVPWPRFKCPDCGNKWK